MTTVREPARELSVVAESDVADGDDRADGAEGDWR